MTEANTTSAKAGMGAPTITADSEARAALRAAIEARGKCRTARDHAKTTLQRAEQVVATAEKEVSRRKSAREIAEAGHAAAITKAIRKGDAPDTNPPAAVAEALRALAEAESQQRAAKAAADALKSELAEAAALFDRAERQVNSAAGHVLVTESAHLAEALRATLAELLHYHDLIVGLDLLPAHYAAGASPALTPELRSAITDARSWDYALGLIRPHRTIMSAAPDAETSARYRDYLKALTNNPDARLDNIAAPEAPKAPTPRHNTIVSSRIAAVADKAGERAA